MRPTLVFQADETGLHIRLPHLETAAEYFQSGNFLPQVLTLPLEALATFEGKGMDLVTLEVSGTDRVRVRWLDAGVPQVVEHEATALDGLPKFPGLPERFVANGPGLLKALDNAANTINAECTREACRKIQLRGQTGEIVATDGRQLLIQRGFDLPWQESILVPRTTVFGCRELEQDAPIQVGRTEHHVTVGVGAWTFHLAIDQDGRYPQVEQSLPKYTEQDTRWSIDQEDAVFLARAIPRLPGHDDDDKPLTVDLNGEICVRAKAAQQQSLTEIVLARSHYAGRPTRFRVNRDFLARALELGFTEVCVASADKPFSCQDATRQFVVMPLDKKGALASADDAVRIASTGAEPISQPVALERKKTAMNAPLQKTSNNGNGHAAPLPTANQPVHDIGSADPSGATGINALIAEAEAVKDALRAVYGRHDRLLVALKRHRKQSKLVQTTLASLRQLQSIES